MAPSAYLTIKVCAMLIMAAGAIGARRDRTGPLLVQREPVLAPLVNRCTADHGDFAAAHSRCGRRRGCDRRSRRKRPEAQSPVACRRRTCRTDRGNDAGRRAHRCPGRRLQAHYRLPGVQSRSIVNFADFPSYSSVEYANRSIHGQSRISRFANGHQCGSNPSPPRPRSSSGLIPTFGTLGFGLR